LASVEKVNQLYADHLPVDRCQGICVFLETLNQRGKPPPLFTYFPASPVATHKQKNPKRTIRGLHVAPEELSFHRSFQVSLRVSAKRFYLDGHVSNTVSESGDINLFVCVHNVFPDHRIQMTASLLETRSHPQLDLALRCGGTEKLPIAKIIVLNEQANVSKVRAKDSKEIL